jgi:hypothetical protein
VSASLSKINSTLDVLRGIKDELANYDVEAGRLSDDLSAFLDTSLQFKDVLDNYCYVNLYFKDTVAEFNENAAKAVAP